MNKHWVGLDFLRGIGLFFLLVMHSAFYYVSGLWDLDLENPPLIITIIGFLLMFAGLFAMISGCVHGISIHQLIHQKQWSPGQILRKKAVSGFFILVVAWLYFLFTGPGLAVFSARQMNNSILVEWILSGRWTGFNQERLLYIDSLVMIGSNVLLVSLIWLLLYKIKKLKPAVLLVVSAAVMILSLLRLPLYPVYLDQVRQGNWWSILLLFWLVNKNNPVLPFLAFGLIGSWVGLRLAEERSHKPIIRVGLILLLAGLILYVFLPDTMLQREIDLKWYSIMVTQLGLFLLLIIAALAVFDRRKLPAGPIGCLCRFFCRFSYAGLTAFFWESIVAALAWRLLAFAVPELRLGIGGALLFGLVLALMWGFFLVLWEKRKYAGSIEYFYGLVVSRLGRFSSKADKLLKGP
ncbi:MAG: hypothetical protein SCM11_15105 [Bacillota bacterium]|nr:hypothetical protein [Bacillota bacterium]